VIGVEVDFAAWHNPLLPNMFRRREGHAYLTRVTSNRKRSKSGGH
jgi:hypothetical protein